MEDGVQSNGAAFVTVYDRTYRGFTGALTGNAQRPLVVTRYALADFFSSRLFVAFFLLCFVPSVVFLVAIYLRYNVEAMVHMGISAGELFDIDTEFFARFFQRPAAMLSFAVVLFVGPALVSPDLREQLDAVVSFAPRHESRLHCREKCWR